MRLSLARSLDDVPAAAPVTLSPLTLAAVAAPAVPAAAVAAAGLSARLLPPVLAPSPVLSRPLRRLLPGHRQPRRRDLVPGLDGRRHQLAHLLGAEIVRLRQVAPQVRHDTEHLAADRAGG